jgi:hypothetical protein
MRRLEEAHEAAQALSAALESYHNDSFLPPYPEWEWQSESTETAFEAYLPHGFHITAAFSEGIIWQVTVAEVAGRLRVPLCNTRGTLKSTLCTAEFSLRNAARKRLAETYRRFRSGHKGATLPCVCTPSKVQTDPGFCQWCHGAEMLPEATLGLVLRQYCGECGQALPRDIWNFCQRCLDTSKGNTDE